MSLRRIVKGLLYCACLAILCVGPQYAESQTPPDVNCKSAKKQCKTAVKRSKKDVKTMNKSLKTIDKLAEQQDRYDQKAVNCVESIQQKIDYQKINAQPYAELCGNGVVAAIESARIWTAGELDALDPATEQDVLRIIDTSVTEVISSLSSVVADYVLALVGLPQECNNLPSNITGCVNAALRGEGCSKLEQCYYIDLGFTEVTLPGRTKVEGNACENRVDICKEQKKAELEAAQEEQKRACEQVKRIVRAVVKRKKDIKRCEDRRQQSYRRMSTKRNTASTRYCTSQSAWEDTDRPAEEVACEPFEGTQCGGTRPYYDGPETSSVAPSC